MPRLDLGISWRQLRSGPHRRSAPCCGSWNGAAPPGDAKIKSWHDGIGKWKRSLEKSSLLQHLLPPRHVDVAASGERQGLLRFHLLHGIVADADPQDYAAGFQGAGEFFGLGV